MTTSQRRSALSFSSGRGDARRGRALASAVLMLPLGLLGGEASWRLAFEDSFEREELGEVWDMVWGEAEIAGGRLHISGYAATAMVDRSFTSDVRVEFEAEADPSQPPCDIACGLAGNNFVGYGYLLQFGARNNQCNQLICPLKNRSLERTLEADMNPPFLIEHGKRYRCVAVKEGPRITYEVDGVRILDATDRDVLGGPGLDRVCVVTWNGLFVDDVRVFERSEAAPGGPTYLEDPAVLDMGYRWGRRRLSREGVADAEIARAIEAYNARDYRTAYDLFSAARPPSLESAVGLAYVVGDLAYDESEDDQRAVARLAADAARLAPGDPAADAFALLAEWFSRVTLASRDKQNSERIHAVGPAHNPFYYKNELFRARYQLAMAQESGWERNRSNAMRIFEALKALWPDHPGIAQLTGERVPWGEELIRDESEGPAWARYLQEGLARSHAVMKWWFTERQAPDGQLGGGWGDDVELMRSWGMPSCITTAGGTAAAGIQRLADGVWTHVLGDMEPHAAEGFGDVEHGAEPAADTHPLMLLLRYGDPRYVERNLKVARIYRDVAMGINERGGIQFKSCEYDLTSVNLNVRALGQNIYHTRAMRHCVWLAWLGLPDARELLLRWAGTLRDVAMAEIGPKPAGYMPFTIFWPSGGIYPPDGRFWLDPKAHYYGVRADKLWKYHYALFSAYSVSGDRSFLEPIDRMMDMASSCAGTLQYDAALPRDHARNLLADFSRQNSPDISTLYRWLTGSSAYDWNGLSAPLRFSIDQDLERYGETLKAALSRLRYNWDLLTTEVLQTDRMDLPGDFAIFGAYTGAVTGLLEDGLVPTVAVTWETPDLDFAAVVLGSTPERLRVLVYNFNETSSRIGLRPWRLVPGSYFLVRGEKPAGRFRPIAWEGPASLVSVRRGTPVQLEIPSRTTWLIDLRLARRIEGGLPDLAIHPRDVRASGSDLVVTVHNIGAGEAGPFDVVLEAARGGSWSVASRARVPGLSRIADFEPARREVILAGAAAAARAAACRVSLDPGNEVEETYDTNNIAALKR